MQKQFSCLLLPSETETHLLLRPSRWATRYSFVIAVNDPQGYVWWCLRSEQRGVARLKHPVWNLCHQGLRGKWLLCPPPCSLLRLASVAVCCQNERIIKHRMQQASWCGPPAADRMFTSSSSVFLSDVPQITAEWRMETTTACLRKCVRGQDRRFESRGETTFVLQESGAQLFLLSGLLFFFFSTLVTVGHWGLLYNCMMCTLQELIHFFGFSQNRHLKIKAKWISKKSSPKAFINLTVLTVKGRRKTLPTRSFKRDMCSFFHPKVYKVCWGFKLNVGDVFRSRCLQDTVEKHLFWLFFLLHLFIAVHQWFLSWSVLLLKFKDIKCVVTPLHKPLLRFGQISSWIKRKMEMLENFTHRLTAMSLLVYFACDKPKKISHRRVSKV